MFVNPALPLKQTDKLELNNIREGGANLVPIFGKLKIENSNMCGGNV